MRYFRRWRPLLHVASLSAVLLNLNDALSDPPPSAVSMQHLIYVTLSLLALGPAIFVAVSIYSPCSSHPGADTSSLHPWQSQTRTIALLVALALPICALALVLVVPLGPSTDAYIRWIDLLAILVSGSILVWGLPARRGNERQSSRAE